MVNEALKGFFIDCKGCSAKIDKNELKANLHVCPKCDHHLYMPVDERFFWLFDEGWEEIFKDVGSKDFLQFRDKKGYSDRLQKLYGKGMSGDSFRCALGEIGGKKVIAGVNDFRFMGGSLGSAAGEKIVRAFEMGLDLQAPVILFHSSGGARMQESTASLMQMARTSTAVSQYKKSCNRPYISVMCNPTTGGVSASYAFLGDINLAEPEALICFAGPRVIEQTIGQSLPEGFQRAEYLLAHGMLDDVSPRSSLISLIKKALSFF